MSSKMRDVTVSIIVPMHNAEGYIEKCAESILIQTPYPQEVIFVDDGSTDTTLKVLEKFPFKILSLGKRHGAGIARNAGAEIAQGEILVFLDADVELKNGALAQLIEDISQPGIDVVSALYTQDLKQGASFYSQFQNALSIYRHSRLSPETLMTFSFFCAIKKEVFVRIGGYSTVFPSYEDIILGHQISQQGYRCRLDAGIKLVHLKIYDHRSLIREYFRKVSVAAAYYIKDEVFKRKVEDNCPLDLKIAGLTSGPLLIAFFLLPYSKGLLLLMAGLYLAASAPLMVFLIRRCGFGFALKSFVLCFEVFLVSFVAYIYGILNSEQCLKS